MQWDELRFARKMLDDFRRKEKIAKEFGGNYLHYSRLIVKWEKKVQDIETGLEKQNA